VAAALAQMGRRTGDRMRDIDPSLADRIAEWMSQNEASASQIRMLQDVVSLEKQEENAIFGESLPSGIVLNK